MTVSLSDKLNAENSGKYILSIRLLPDGLSFSCLDPTIGGKFFMDETRFDGSKPYLTSLEEYFFNNNMFSQNYRRTRIIVVSDRYTLVPTETLIDKEAERKRLLDFVFRRPTDFCLSNKLRTINASLLFGMDNDVYAFCKRSFGTPDFYHHLFPILRLLYRQSMNALAAVMTVIIRQETVDIVCFRQSALLFINSFNYKNDADLLYYILYVWQQVGLDQQKDGLRLWGNNKTCTNITFSLAKFIQNISLLELPSEVYLHGAEIAHAPLDMIALSICE